jgi:hypothetical protein
VRYEWPPVLGDAVDGDEQFAHRGNDCDLPQLAASDQALVVDAQPRIETDSTEGGHPELGAQASVPQRMQAGALALTFAGLSEARHGADEGRECAGATEVRGVADSRDEAGRGLRPDPWDGREELADIVGVQQALDITFHGAEAAAPEVEIFAGVADLQAIGLTVVLTDRGCRRGDECLRQLSSPTR